MTAVLNTRMIQIVNWNYMPDFYVCVMQMNMFQIELFCPVKLLSNLTLVCYQSAQLCI
jgi:hypothetical protein